MRHNKTLTLVHYSANLVSSVYSVKQEDEPAWKPIGFWLSVEGSGDGWKEWCEGEQFRLDTFAFAYDVKLIPTTRIVRLSSATGIDIFDDQYRRNSDLSSFRSIDWAKVAQEYQGIIIAPYIWARRLHPKGKASWYYGWDCASGCIWDANAVESITLRGVDK